MNTLSDFILDKMIPALTVLMLIGMVVLGVIAAINL
jgi:hypothetical protein